MLLSRRFCRVWASFVAYEQVLSRMSMYCRARCVTYGHALWNLNYVAHGGCRVLASPYATKTTNILFSNLLICFVSGSTCHVSFFLLRHSFSRMHYTWQTYFVTNFHVTSSLFHAWLASIFLVVYTHKHTYTHGCQKRESTRQNRRVHVYTSRNRVNSHTESSYTQTRSNSVLTRSNSVKSAS